MGGSDESAAASRGNVVALAFCKRTICWSVARSVSTRTVVADRVCSATMVTLTRDRSARVVIAHDYSATGRSAVIALDMGTAWVLRKRLALMLCKWDQQAGR